MSLAKGLSILFIFSKNHILVLLIFTTVSFVSFSIISAWIFMISFLLLILGLFCSSFSSCFRCKVRLSIQCFSSFFRVSTFTTIIQYSSRSPSYRLYCLTSLLELFLLHPIGFQLCFHCHLFLEIF